MTNTEKTVDKDDIYASVKAILGWMALHADLSDIVSQCEIDIAVSSKPFHADIVVPPESVKVITDGTEDRKHGG